MAIDRTAITIWPAPPADVQPGDVVYTAGQQVEINGVTRTVAVDAVVTSDLRLDVQFQVEWVTAPREGLIDLTPKSPIPLPSRYSDLFNQPGSFIIPGSGTS